MLKEGFIGFVVSFVMIVLRFTDIASLVVIIVSAAAVMLLVVGVFI